MKDLDYYQIKARQKKGFTIRIWLNRLVIIIPAMAGILLYAFSIESFKHLSRQKEQLSEQTSRLQRDVHLLTTELKTMGSMDSVVSLRDYIALKNSQINQQLLIDSTVRILNPSYDYVRWTTRDSGNGLYQVDITTRDPSNILYIEFFIKDNFGNVAYYRTKSGKLILDSVRIIPSKQNTTVIKTLRNLSQVIFPVKN
jgi:hypothetical protein